MAFGVPEKLPLPGFTRAHCTVPLGGARCQPDGSLGLAMFGHAPTRCFRSPGAPRARARTRTHGHGAPSRTERQCLPLLLAVLVLAFTVAPHLRNLVSINRRHFGAVRGIYSASVNVKFEEGATFIFGSWLCTANQDGKLRHELRYVMIALRREFRDETMASPPPPARVTVRRSLRVSDSDTILGLYPTRMSTWRQKPSSTRTNDDSGLVALKYQDQAYSRRTRLLGGLRIISSIRQGTSVRTAKINPATSVAKVLFLFEQGSFFDKNPDYGNQQGSFFDKNPNYDDQPSSFSTKNSDSARLHQQILNILHRLAGSHARGLAPTNYVFIDSPAPKLEGWHPRTPRHTSVDSSVFELGG
nr:unnamed protein product [Digitaria exilis]